MKTVTLFTRRGCHLCAEVRSKLLLAAKRAEFQLEERDIDADPALYALYNEEVPVVAIDGRPLFRYAMDVEAFLKALTRQDS